MARARFPVKPFALYQLVEELRTATRDERPLLVAGSREQAAALRRELVAGGDESAVREGGTLEEIAALVYVLAGAVSEADERELRAARRSGLPIVCVLVAPPTDGGIPHVLADDVVHASSGSALPVDDVARNLAAKLGEGGTSLAARLPVLRRPVAEELIRKFARQNAVAAVVIFLPGADMPVLTLNQIRLVLRIGLAYGFRLDRHRLTEVLAVIGGGLGLRALARQALSFIPVAGWAVQGAIAYGGTRAVGEAAVRYFETRATMRL